MKGNIISQAMGALNVKTFLWSGESGLADIWRRLSSSAELSTREKSDQKSFISHLIKLHQHAGFGMKLDRELNLGDLGLLGQLGFSSRFLPVNLVPVDPASELVSQPATGTQAALSDAAGTDSSQQVWRIKGRKGRRKRKS